MEYPLYTQTDCNILLDNSMEYPLYTKLHCNVLLDKSIEYPLYTQPSGVPTRRVFHA